MSGWIDPLGVRTLHRFIQAETHRLDDLIAEAERMHPGSRRLSRYRARQAELGKVQALLQAVERPGLEMRPHKALVNQHAERAARIRELDAPRHAYLVEFDRRQRKIA